MIQFRNIYFDSDVLIASGWPELSTEMRNVLKLAKALKLKSFLLDPVERELEAHWTRDLHKTQSEAAGKTAQLARVLAKINAAADLQRPSHDEVRGLYSAKVREAVGFGLDRAPASNRPLMEVFELAIKRRQPFGERDSGFKDAVICLSAIDHLAQLGDKKGAFVSKDKGFRQDSIDLLTERSGVSLVHFSELDALRNVLIGEIGEKITTCWDKDRRRAAEAGEENLQLLQDFISHNLSIPVRLESADIVRVEGVKILSILGADTPFPFGERQEASPLKLSLDAKVQLQVLARERPRLVWAGPRTLKVGEERPRAVFVRRPDPQPPRQMNLEKIAELEIEAMDAEGMYKNLKPISVKLKQEKISLGPGLPGPGQYERSG